MNALRRRRPPLILQSGATECGLACVAMVSGYYGGESTLRTLRERFRVSARGASMARLMDIAQQLGLEAVALRLVAEQLPLLKLPAILHWGDNHFVVLETLGRKRCTVLDPARGRIVVNRAQVEGSFRGHAIELSSTPALQPVPAAVAPKLGRFLLSVKRLPEFAGYLIFLSVALEIIAVLSPLYVQITLDHAVPHSDIDLLVRLAVAFASVLLFQHGLSVLRSLLFIHLKTDLGRQFSRRLFEHLVRLPIEYFERRNVGDIVSRFASLARIQRILTSHFIESLVDGAMVCVTLAVMLFYSTLLGLVTLSSTLLYGAARLALYPQLKTAMQEQLAREAKQQNHFLESVRAVEAIRLLNGTVRRINDWYTLFADELASRVRADRLSLTFATTSGLILGLDALLITALAAWLVIGKSFTVGMFFAFLAYKAQFSRRSIGLIDRLAELQTVRVHVERMADIVVPESEPPDDVMLPGVRFRKLELCDVSYQYEPGAKPVLCGVSFTVNTGTHIAIVGPSGSGKTTLLRIMLGLYRPTQGDVLFNGLDLRRVAPGEYRADVAAVMQADHLFAGSIADNITFFSDSPDLARIKESARLAEIANEIEPLPMGYATLLGDNGATLSGGQKQRLLIARALYRQPKLLVLDEPTNHLDDACARRLMSNLANLGIGLVFVSHDPTYLLHADAVIDLTEGFKWCKPGEVRVRA